MAMIRKPYRMSHDPDALNPGGTYPCSVPVSTGRIVDRRDFDDIRTRSDNVRLP